MSELRSPSSLFLSTTPARRTLRDRMRRRTQRRSSHRPIASMPMRQVSGGAATERSLLQLRGIGFGTTVAIRLAAAASSSFTVRGLEQAAWEIPRTLHDLNKSGGPTSFGSETDTRSVSGLPRCSAVAELWGDFEWEDAA